MVNDKADDSDDNHDRHLLPLALVDDDKTKGKSRDEYDLMGKRHFPLAGDRGGGILIQSSVESGADCNTKSEEERVNHGIDHAYGASNNVARLKLKRAAD